ncbi:MAG: tetratricopeptide repeat protein [Leptonema sp. (in: bacteria)]
MQKVVILFLSLIFLIVVPLNSQSFNFLPEEFSSLKQLSSSELLEKANESYQKGNYYASIQFVTEYLERNPEDLNHAIFLAKNYIYIQDCSRALKVLDRFSNRFAEVQTIEILKNYCYLENGLLQKVKENLSELEKSSINEPEFWLLKGKYYLKINRYDFAYMYYNKYLNHFPNEYQIYLKMFELAIQKQNFANALSLINDFKKRFPENIEYFKLLGDYYYKLSMNQTTTQKEILLKSYNHYKTYLNFVPFDPQIYEILLFIAYTLDDKDKLKNLLKEFSYLPKNTLLLANINEIFKEKSTWETLENLCKENKIPFSCIRYDFSLMKSNSDKKIIRIKKYLETVNVLKREKKPYDSLLFWLNQFDKEYEMILKEFLDYYKNSLFYEDYYLVLNELIKKTNDPKLVLLSEKFYKEREKHIPFQLFSNYPLQFIKQAYKRNKKNILILNPFPLEQKESHFKESEILRNFIDYYVNQIPYFATIPSSDFVEIKRRVLNSEQYYMFYHPEFINAIREWETEQNKPVDYILESNYRILNESFSISLILRNSTGLVIQKQDFFYPKNSEFAFLKDLENFLLYSINLEGIFLKTFKDKILINLGSVDRLKKNQVFKFKNNYYKVSEVFSYVSLLSLIKGQPLDHTENDVFIRVSQPN